LKTIACILFVIVGFTLAPPALASDQTISRAVLDDPTGSLTIADVAGRVTTPVGPSYYMASSQGAHWICVRVQAPAHGGKVVLFLRPTSLNEVRLYEAGTGTPLTWKTRVTGNLFPFAERDRASISLGFVVEVPAPEATYYLRVKTRSPAQFSVEAMEPAEADRWDHNRDLVLVFFVTAMLSLFFWAINSYLLDRQRVVGLFAVHQAVYTLFGISATGYLAPLFVTRFPLLIDWVSAALYLAINFTPVLFCRELFKPYEPPPLLMRGLNLLLFTFPVLLAAMAMGYGAFAIISNAALIKITWLFFVVIAFSLRTERTPRRRLVRFFFVAVFASNLVFWLASRSGRIASIVNLTAIQVLIVDGLIIGGLFALILHTRARQVRVEAQQSALNLMLVQKKLELEQELKKHAELLARTDYLTGLSNRRCFFESAERELERAIRFKRPLTLLMIDIDHFKAINDTWGHGIGDIVLQNVSHMLRNELRNVDIFGRTGGEEFAAVLVETGGEDAFEVARRLCAIVAAAVIAPLGAGPIRVSVSIGLSGLEGRNIRFNSLLNEADRAMYKAKQAGRNRVAVCEEG
jgi:diguanylate cyclase (GGDEF)-like protein